MPKNKNILYEINTPVWLNSLSLKYGHSVTLAEVPDSEIEKLADMGVDCVWLMGIWERSPRAVEIERAAEGHTETFENVLPDFSEDDFIGSAYSVKSYTINSDFGDHESLATLRQNLRNKGIGLILDFVPNHTAPDHQWTADNPDFYIHGGEHAQNEPENYIECSGNVLAKGRDPKFPAWSDVVQVNAFSQGYRQAAISTIKDISEMCDGVRCDMAMLLMNDIFNENWGLKAGNVPETDFWKEIINGVRASSPDFIFLAEVYWGREKDLIDQGFDYCYDKVMYDLLLEDNVDEVNKQLNKTSGYQAGMARFIENHDEPRAAATFIPTGKQKAAAAFIATLPGLWLFHDGQAEGFKVKLPVHVNRKPVEEVDQDLNSFYVHLLRLVQGFKLHEGEWQNLNADEQGLLGSIWNVDHKSYFVIINYQGEANTVSLKLPTNSATLHDHINNKELEIEEATLEYELKPWEVLLLSS